jgi:hypothetical protein
MKEIQVKFFCDLDECPYGRPDQCVSEGPDGEAFVCQSFIVKRARKNVRAALCGHNEADKLASDIYPEAKGVNVILEKRSLEE